MASRTFVLSCTVCWKVESTTTFTLRITSTSRDSELSRAIDGSCTLEKCGLATEPGECGCDDLCKVFSDCCENRDEVCGSSDGQGEEDTNFSASLCTDSLSCGECPGDCCCDAWCTAWGDCCEDFEAVCGEAVQAQTSCVGRCEEAEMADGAICACDEICSMFGDCCDDYMSECRMKACKGRCAEECPYNEEGVSCCCDASCFYYGDCCDDLAEACLPDVDTVAYGLACDGQCGQKACLTNEETGDTGCCYCDEVCLQMGDCCSDFLDACLIPAVEAAKTAPEEPSCSNNCGKKSVCVGEACCSCAPGCEEEEEGGCCADRAALCPVADAAVSCSNKCGVERELCPDSLEGEGPAQEGCCRCDNLCTFYGDCCEDYELHCTELTCSGRCGKYCEETGGSDEAVDTDSDTELRIDCCSCDAYCQYVGDCCWDLSSSC